MKILHIYPPNDSQLAQYVSLLMKHMKQDVESVATDHLKAAPKLIIELHPDIVHLHGDIHSQLPSSLRLVVTPHGHPVTLNAYALIARSSIEQSTLASHYERIELIRNPIITRTTTPQELASETLRVYRKVMDSNVLELMDADTLLMLKQLLKAAICGNHEWVTEALPKQTDWRKLFIYAEHEGIGHLLRHGINIMQLSIEPIDAAQIPTFLPTGFHRPEPSSKTDLPQIIEQAYVEVANGQLSMLRLCELHQALMSPDVDDEVLVKTLQGSHRLAFFSSMLQLLCEQTGLDEGFMPCKPTNNDTTQQLRILLKKHLQI